MKIYLLNAFSVLLYALVDYAIRLLRQSPGLRQRKTLSPGNASPVLFSVLVIQEILFLGTRATTVGVDTARYAYVFENIFRYEFRYERGFTLFVKLIRQLTADESVFLLVAAAICLLPIGFVIYRFSQMPYLSWYIFICMFYFSFFFSGMRQSIAMALLFIAFYLLVKNKPIWAVAVVLLASTFHLSSITFLLLVLLYKHKMKKWEFFVFVPAYLLIFLFRSPIFNIILRIMYEDYEQVETNAYTWMSIQLILFLLLYFFNFTLREDRVRQLALTSMTIGCAFILLTSVGTNVLRVANYFNIFMVLLIPNSMRAIPKKLRPFVVLAGIGVLTVFYIIHLQNNPYSIIPYRSTLF